MKRLATERLINRTRYLFTAFFLVTGYASYRGGSDPRVYLAIFAASGVFLLHHGGAGPVLLHPVRVLL